METKSEEYIKLQEKIEERKKWKANQKNQTIAGCVGIGIIIISIPFSVHIKNALNGDTGVMNICYFVFLLVIVGFATLFPIRKPKITDEEMVAEAKKKIKELEAGIERSKEEIIDIGEDIEYATNRIKSLESIIKA